MIIKTFDGINIYYNKINKIKDKKEKKYAVFIHGGFQGNNTLIKKLYSYFYDEYVIIAPDLRGRGDSDFPKDIKNHKLEDYAKDILEILEKEKIKEIYLVGISFGGLVALKFTYMFSNLVDIKKLVLISSNYTLKKIRKRTRLFGLFYIPLGNLVYYLSKNGKLTKKKGIDYSSIKNPFFSIKYGLKSTLNNSLRVQALRYQLMKSSMNFSIDNEDLKKVICPVLLIYGKKDFFFNKKTQYDILKNIKKCEIKIFQKGGHNLYIDNAKEVSKIIKAFFNKKD
ncbi:MAG: alpha/beta hydrolase [Candidatus Woesearchaeota archaeon]